MNNICLIYDRGYPSYELCGEKKDKRRDKLIERFDLPESIKMRVLKLELKTREDEVLITNIFEEEFEIEDFREIYRLRWGEEEFYKVIKERLSMENFSGLSVEGVRQDFESTMFMTNIESVFSEEVDEELEKKCEKLSENYRTYSENSVFSPPIPLARGNLGYLVKIVQLI